MGKEEEVNKLRLIFGDASPDFEEKLEKAGVEVDKLGSDADDSGSGGTTSK